MERKDRYVPDIDDQYIVKYRFNGSVYSEVYTVFEGDSSEKEFVKALEFAKTVDTIVFYEELSFKFFNPKTGKEVKTPHLGSGIHYYGLQNYHPAGFCAIDIEDLPF